MKHTIREELRGILIFIGVIWAVSVFNIHFHDFDRLALVPRTLQGVKGIVAMPFLHAGYGHLISNTIPLFVLLALLAGSRARSWLIVIQIGLVSGTLLWFVGWHDRYVGASGLIFGLAVFLIASGILERRIVPILIAVVVVLLYGGSLLAGMLPNAGPGIAWDGHLCGAVAGGGVAWFQNRGERKDD